MNAIANAIRRAEGHNFTTTDEQFAAFYDHLPDSDPARDVYVAERDGRLVAYGRVGFRRDPDGLGRYELNPFASADEAGGAVLRGLIETLESRAREIAAEREPGRNVLDTFGGDEAPERSAILLERGYTPIRYWFAMVRPSVDDLPDAPLPDGLEIREVQPEHLRAIWDAGQEAFAGTWGNEPGDEADFERFRTDPVTSDTTLWRIAWDGDEVAGQVRSFIHDEQNEQFRRKRGYVENISVRAPWRRRGLARALIAASFPLLRARGMTEAALNVDSENESGAFRVYEGCGFRVVGRSATFRKPID